MEIRTINTQISGISTKGLQQLKAIAKKRSSIRIIAQDIVDIVGKMSMDDINLVISTLPQERAFFDRCLEVANGLRHIDFVADNTLPVKRIVRQPISVQDRIAKEGITFPTVQKNRIVMVTRKHDMLSSDDMKTIFDGDRMRSAKEMKQYVKDLQDNTEVVDITILPLIGKFDKKNMTYYPTSGAVTKGLSVDSVKKIAIEMGIIKG